MFGGIAALGSDSIVYTTSDGHIVHFDAETGAVTGQQALYPVAPRRLHVAACTFDDRRDLLVADARHGLVRVVDPDGCQRERIGGLATPGVDREDSPGVLHEPCELLWTAENETSLRKVLFAPLAGLATPFVFVGDWLGRATWPIDPRVEEE